MFDVKQREFITLVGGAAAASVARRRPERIVREP